MSERTPRRIQRKRHKGWRMPAGAVSVTRPGPWGNYAGRTASDYQRWIDEMDNSDRAFFMDQIKALRGKDLACWCPLHEPCHADVLLEIANDFPQQTAPQNCTTTKTSTDENR